jgi:hypothetical protein
MFEVNLILGCVANCVALLIQACICMWQKSYPESVWTSLRQARFGGFVLLVCAWLTGSGSDYDAVSTAFKVMGVIWILAFFAAAAADIVKHRMMVKSGSSTAVLPASHGGGALLCGIFLLIFAYLLG